MRSILKNRLALSTVVTTLIILVVSVLLAGVVTYYAINVTSTRVEEEAIHMTKLHVWCDNSSNSQAAFMLINTGGRDIVLDRVTVRGQESLWTDVYYNVTTEAIAEDLEHQSSLSAGDILIGTDNFTFVQGSTDVILKSGETLLVYIDSPDSISVNDIGLTVGVNVFTSQAMHYKECNVEAA